MIHIVWTGYGYLVAVFTFSFSLLANLITNSVTGSSAYWDSHKWPVGASLLLSALVCLFVGSSFRGRNSRALTDEETGERVVLRESHTLFFIPIVWWALIVAFCGALAIAWDVVQTA